MGIEYRHYLVVNDPEWRPAADTVSRVEEILRAWGIATQRTRVVDLAGGTVRDLPLTDHALASDEGVGLTYEEIQGPPVARLAGPSYHGVAEDERYLMKVVLIIGQDYRIQWSSESIYFELSTPPTDASGEPIEAYADEEPFEIAYASSFPSQHATASPVVEAHVAETAQENIAWEDCQGFWRGAVVIDFGKDLPAFVEGRHALPATAFVTALGDAFRGPLVEVGEIY